MYTIKEAVIVEGTYDKIKLSSFLDGVIFVTGGFSVISNKKRLATIKTLAEEMGIVILTDSDSAGFKIRNYIKQSIPENQVKHAYIPDISGKEKRKNKPGKEGLLGVEGISQEIIIKALRDAGCEIDGNSENISPSRPITKADLYMLGLSGDQNSTKKRQTLSNNLGLPSKISSNMLISVLNRLMTYDELVMLCNELFQSETE